MSLISMMDEVARESGPHKHVMAVMAPGKGDVKTVWDPAKPAEVKVAEDAFKKAKRQGLVAYRVRKDGSKSEVMHNFDPDAEAMILAPALRGG